MGGVGPIDTVSSASPAEGSASASKQDDQIQQLQDILTALGLVATEATAGEIKDAVVALGDGATLADLATSLSTIATNTGGAGTEITASSLLAELTAQGVDLDTVVSTLTTIESEVDDLETITAAVRDRLPSTIGRLAAAASLGIALSTEDKAVIDAIKTGTDKLLSAGRAAAASSSPVALSTEDLAKLGAGLPSALGQLARAVSLGVFSNVIAALVNPIDSGKTITVRACLPIPIPGQGYPPTVTVERYAAVLSPTPVPGGPAAPTAQKLDPASSAAVALLYTSADSLIPEGDIADLTFTMPLAAIVALDSRDPGVDVIIPQGGTAVIEADSNGGGVPVLFAAHWEESAV